VGQGCLEEQGTAGTRERARRFTFAACAVLASAGAALTWPALAVAHVGGNAFILLLPTRLYLAGGAVAVAASFALITAVPPRLFARLETLSLQWNVGGLPRHDALATGASLLSFAAVVLLVTAGLLGSRDPLANPLPLFVWTVWWIGFTYLHAVFGNLWAHLNPWTGLHRLATSAGPLRACRERPPLAYPPSVGHWPAVAGFLLFAWFELVYPAPADPVVLAGVVAAYVAAQFVGLLVFGDPWLREAEPFSVFFRVVSWIAPLGLRVKDDHGAGRMPRVGVELTFPALRLLRVEAPRGSLAAFVLLVLASVSFDGLSRTFAWLGILGENPLAYPGRTVLMAPDTLGLLGVYLGLLLAYVAAAALSGRLARVRLPLRQLVTLFVLPLVPIACGYHFAHYLPAFLVDVQHAIRAASDPMGWGWNLLGTRDLPVVTSFLSDPVRVYAIWNSQVTIIVAAHVAGVTIAHALALRLVGPARAAVSQLPMLVLMIGYTTLGLWLLSTPAVG
jgi:hypothetical protein